MTVVITEEVTVEDLDEAMRHIQILLATDLKPARRNVLLETLDDLLDERLKLANLKPQ